MEDIIYTIRNMYCSYDKNKSKSDAVLHVKELDIPRGKVIFFVGPSGVGKSTILETLGLMNNTLAYAEVFDYAGRDLRNAWNWKDKEKSAFRNKEFSFIFQQNNLMPNFSAHDNIITASLFQGESEFLARKRTIDILKKLDLPIEDRPISQYSGGQKQRIAFARAVLPTFSVFFGDEPTGNLDCKSAERLMKLMVEAIHERNSTAIIVSHDIPLAVKYADEIVQIVKIPHPLNPNDFIGFIDNSCAYIRKNEKWHNSMSTLDEEEIRVKLIEAL